MTRLRTGALALLLGGCSFTEIPPASESVVINRCETDDECVNSRCRSNMCVESSTTLAPFLVEITPPSNSTVGGLPFYTRLESAAGDIVIGAVGNVTTTITTSVDAACWFEGPPPDRAALSPSNGSIPAHLSFVPSERALGIPTPTYVTTSGPSEPFREGVDLYRSTTSLAPGEYDIYVEPRRVPPPQGAFEGEGCDLPPLLVRGHDISGSVALGIELPPPSVIELRVRGPAGDATLTDWSVEVLDFVSGRVLSAPKTLRAPVVTETGSEYAETIAFFPAHVVEDSELTSDRERLGREVIRLSPPSDIVAPSFLFQRLGLRLSDAPDAPDIIDLTPPDGYSPSGSLLPMKVTIEGQASDLETGMPVAAAVTLASKSIEGASRQASFITTIQIDEKGVFRTVLPAGVYAVRAAPPLELGLAAVETEWHIRSSTDVQAGKTIEIPRAPVLSGEVHANGSAVFGATASAIVSPLAVQSDVLEQTLGRPPLLPGSSTGIVARDGHFDVPCTAVPLPVNIDSNEPRPEDVYDFYVRPEARSRFPWLVLPSIAVPQEGLDVGRRRLSLPFVHRGEVIEASTKVRIPGALIRAYVYVTDTGAYTSDVAMSAAVIPVAETRADESGAFELLIPASLDVQ